MHRRAIKTFGVWVRCCLYSVDTGNLREITVRECFQNKIHFEPKSIMASDRKLMSYAYMSHTPECQMRNAALLSLDREKILAYCQAYDVYYPEDEAQFWIDVHKARAVMSKRVITKREKEESVRWLLAHGVEWSRWRMDEDEGGEGTIVEILDPDE